MKIAGFILTTLLLSFAPSAFSSQQNIQVTVIDRKISIQAEAAPLGRLLALFDQAMETKSTIPADLTNRIVTVRLSSLGFDDAVRKIFEGLSLDYIVIRGKGVVVTGISQNALCDIADASPAPRCSAPMEEATREEGRNNPSIQDPFPGYKPEDDHFPLRDSPGTPEHSTPTFPAPQSNTNSPDTPYNGGQGSSGSTTAAGPGFAGAPAGKALELLTEPQRRLPIEQVQPILDKGTVLLSYTVTQTETVLYAVRSNMDRGADSGVREIHIPVSNSELQSKIAAFRQLIQKTAEPEVVQQEGRRLFDLLIGQVADEWVENSARVLISPDGPLRLLPFGALVGSHYQYLVERKPLHILTSAIRYVEAKKARREGIIEPRLSAFGDAKNSSGTQAEVDQILELFGRDAAVYATKDQFLKSEKDVQYIHFATPTLLNESSPLNSAVVLAPDQTKASPDNGMLEAGEIANQQIDVDLVTLSHSETALDKDSGGEGFFGLLKAFQYAGARSVLGSLWIGDHESTAQLMQAFYKYVMAEYSKDQALQKAQLDLIRNAGTAHPINWASFELTGDWK